MLSLGYFYLGFSAALTFIFAGVVASAPKVERIGAAAWAALIAVFWPALAVALAIDAIIARGTRLARRLIDR